jgi:hypothetical protein
MPNRQARRSARPQGRTVPGDEIQVRAFLIADHAAHEQNGKLYINGGGVEWVGVQQSDPVRLPFLWLVIRLGFPWRLTSGGHLVEVRILDQDEKPVGADPFMRGDVQIGRPPGTEPGDEFAIQLAVTLTGYEINRPPDTRIVFHLLVDDLEIATLSLRLRALVQVPGMVR